MTQHPVAICGGGISGLALAYRLFKKGIPFELFEASGRFGGNIVTCAHDGFLYDLGPDSFLRTKPAAAALCKEVGLGGQLIAPREGGAGVLVAHDGRLCPLPEGLTLGVPKRPGPILTTPLLSAEAKLRALLEPFVPPGGASEETIAQFMSRRLGKEAAAVLASPLLAGVFAGDAERLSMAAAFPQLVAAEKKHGSLFSGLNGGKGIFEVLFSRSSPAQNPFLSLRGGLGKLVERLVEQLPKKHLHLNRRVCSLQSHSEGARLDLLSSRGERSSQVARQVCFAGPPWAAAALFSTMQAALSEPLTAIRGFSTATVFFGFDARTVDHSLSASGFIVPPGEGDILASTFISSKWESRAPAGKVLIRAFLGGARTDIREQTDSSLVLTARSELSRLLGRLGEPEFSRVHRYERGTPQPEIGHQKRLQQIHSELAEVPWLSLLGSGYGSVGIPDCLAQANARAESIEQGS